jgi:hypothetical protein
LRAPPNRGEHVTGLRIVPELEPPDSAERASRDGSENRTVPNRYARCGGEQRAQIGGEENETAAARPRHYKANGRTRRLEPDAERLHWTTERDQAGKGEGGWDGQNTPGHDPA